MTSINQWIPAAHRGDAIGDSARRVRELLRRMGHDSHIYALTIDEDMRDEVRPFDDPQAHQGSVTIFHYALPSPMTEAFGRLSGRRVLQYHNITPAHFFANYAPEIFRIAALGRDDLATLATRTDLALGDSEFNRRELAQLGFPNTGVLPIALDLARLTGASRHPVLEKMLGDGLTNFLFVGRVVPNKRVDDIIRLAEVYKRYIDANYRFIFVGRTDGVPRYRTASVYLSLSEHEGFCVPLLEAMACDVPVFAYDCTAVGETLGGAGVCWSPKDLELAAELLGQLAFDPVMRARVVAGQRERLMDFSEARLVEQLEGVVAAGL